MKKLALLLGSLLVVGTAVQAKEVIVAPVEVSKEVIVVAEPVVEEVVVVELTPEFKPSGYLGLEYKAYGETEGHGDKISSGDTWHKGKNNYARLQTTFGVQATEKFSVQGRIRDYSDLETNDDKYDNAKQGTETRLRAYYKHNDLFTSRVEYKDATDEKQSFEYQARLNVYKNEGGLLSNLVFAPKFKHTMAANNGGAYKNTVGADIDYAGNLPLGFTWDGTIYLNQNFYGEDFHTNSDLTNNKDKAFEPEWEIYLRRNFALYANNNYALDFNFEGGYDPYIFGQYDKYSLNKEKGTITKSEKNSYELYALLTLDLEYKVTENFALSTGAGAEYRNWDKIGQSEASDWRWQPVAYAAMKVTF